MQALSTTSQFPKFNPENQNQHNEDQGFAEEEHQSLIVPKKQIHDDLCINKNTQAKHRYNEPKIKLTFVSRQKNSREQLRKSIISKQQRNLHGKSLQLGKKDQKLPIKPNYLDDCLIKIKRTVVGDNISIPLFSLNDSKSIKTYILQSGATLVYEQNRQINSHGYFRSLSETNKQYNFLNFPSNQLLKGKLKQSFIMPRKNLCRNNSNGKIQFNGNFESANIQFVAEIQQNKYEIFLRNDTNTHGHQSWFLFSLYNNYQSPQNIKIQISNIKRDLKLINQGAMIYTRRLNNKGQTIGQWKYSGQNISLVLNQGAKFTNNKVYKLSFQLQVQGDQGLQISLLPPFTYSDLLKQLSLLPKRDYLSIQTLTYSLIGLAIPLLTFTFGDYQHKNVILISCRIHPGETNSSFMCNGLIKWLCSDSAKIKQFLQKNIIKIIPMINPDGVVYGNFRTRLDLNRNFQSEDQITNPQIVALKQLGQDLKKQYGQRFNLFIDFHGHSSQKNIFTYGPQYQTTQTNFYQIRLLPKILGIRSQLFSYYNCSFRLQDYKKGTARGYFLNNVKVLAYTIQSSYSIFVKDGKNQLMGIKQWQKFGVQFGQSLLLFVKISKLSTIRSKLQIKKALGIADNEQLQMIKKFKKQFKQQRNILSPRKSQKKKQKNGEDSDGQADNQDYTRGQRQEVTRRIAEIVAPSMILPRVLKPSIVYPTVTPKLFKIRQDFEVTHLKILYTKRSNKFNSLRNPGNTYIHSLRGMQLNKLQLKNY